MDVRHSVEIPRNAIQQAPNVRVQNEIHVKCKEGQTQDLECCVQPSYRVTWYLDTNTLPASKSWKANTFNHTVDRYHNRCSIFAGVTDSTQSYCITHAYPLGGCNEVQQNSIRFTCNVDDLEGYEKMTTLNLFRGGRSYIWIFMMSHFGSLVVRLTTCGFFYP